MAFGVSQKVSHDISMALGKGLHGLKVEAMAPQKKGFSIRGMSWRAFVESVLLGVFIITVAAIPVIVTRVDAPESLIVAKEILQDWCTSPICFVVLIIGVMVATSGVWGSDAGSGTTPEQNHKMFAESYLTQGPVSVTQMDPLRMPDIFFSPEVARANALSHSPAYPMTLSAQPTSVVVPVYYPALIPPQSSPFSHKDETDVEDDRLLSRLGAEGNGGDRYLPRVEERYLPHVVDDRFVSRMDERFSPRMEERFSLEVDERFSPRVDERFGSKAEDRFGPRVEERFSPRLEERFMPHVEETYLPQVEERYVPRVQETYLPHVEERYVPQVQETYLPHVEERYVPQVQETYLPQVEERYVPQVQEMYVPQVEERYESQEQDRFDPEEDPYEPEEQQTSRYDAPHVERATGHDDDYEEVRAESEDEEGHRYSHVEEQVANADCEDELEPELDEREDVVSEEREVELRSDIEEEVERYPLECYEDHEEEDEQPLPEVVSPPHPPSAPEAPPAIAPSQLPPSRSQNYSDSEATVTSVDAEPVLPSRRKPPTVPTPVSVATTPDVSGPVVPTPSASSPKISVRVERKEIKEITSSETSRSPSSPSSTLSPPTPPRHASGRRPLSSSSSSRSYGEFVRRSSNFSPRTSWPHLPAVKVSSPPRTSSSNHRPKTDAVDTKLDPKVDPKLAGEKSTSPVKAAASTGGLLKQLSKPARKPREVRVVDDESLDVRDETQDAGEEDDVNQRVEAFLRNFKEQMRLQRQESLQRHRRSVLDP